MDFSASDACEHFDIDDFAAPFLNVMPPSKPPSSSLYARSSPTTDSHQKYTALPSAPSNKNTPSTTISLKAATKAYDDEHDEFYSSSMYTEEKFSYDGRSDGGVEAEEEEEDFGAFMGRIATLRQDAEVRKALLANKKQLVATLHAKKAALEVEVAGVRGSIEADLIEKRFGQLRVQNGWEEALRRAQVALSALQSATAVSESNARASTHQQPTPPPPPSPFSIVTLSTFLNRYFPKLLHHFDACIESVVLPALHAHDEFTDSVVGGMERARMRRIALERHTGLHPKTHTTTAHPPSITLLSYLLTSLVSQTTSSTTAHCDDTSGGTILAHTPHSTSTPSSYSSKHASSWCLRSDRLFIGTALADSNHSHQHDTAAARPHTPTWDTVLGPRRQSLIYCEADEYGGEELHHQKCSAIVAFLEALLGLTNTVIQ